jgi:hypothetical protein
MEQVKAGVVAPAVAEMPGIAGAAVAFEGQVGGARRSFPAP